MPVEKLKAFLDQNGVRYVVIKHSSAYTSQEVAASAHVSGREFAKTVMIRIDDKMGGCVAGILSNRFWSPQGNFQK